ncbi:MAG: peptidoglycan DD-metalloendopeptidase family protein [Sideroxydans sp.]|nr:peptidoglycan DD-metalloendopeptidase family protein [Sideroxydans sp.]
MMDAQFSQALKTRYALWLVSFAAALLTACAVPVPAPGGRRAPIVEYDISDKKPSAVAPKAVTPPAAVAPASTSVPAKIAETTSRVYVVQKGDTLYSIAFLNGVDYREVAEQNNLQDPAAIKIGQLLHLNVPVAETAAVAETKPVLVQPPAQPGGIKNQPKVGRLPYSENALARAEHIQDDVAPPAHPSAGGAAKETGDEEAIEWGMPTSGKLIAGFSESDNRKGVDIVGKRGQVVVASASGKVVYSGSGLRGYGKLIIIKHNKTYLSAYAHNDQILVKEGQTVSKGQKIAEMGNSDADQVKLHFEIRKLGKPVDPAKYLPLVKS